MMKILLGFIGLASGIVIAGGVFAFIAIIGIVPRLVQKTKTSRYIRVYEDSIMLGGILGALTIVIPIEMIIHKVVLVAFGFFSGVFVGSLAVSLAEVLDVIPILTRRVHLKVGICYFLLSLAIGKMIGALIYFGVPGFVIYK